MISGAGKAAANDCDAALILEIFEAVAARDQQGLLDLYHPSIEFHEPQSLPYGGRWNGLAAVKQHAKIWRATWDPVQTPADRDMEPRVIASNAGEVLMLWWQKGRSANGAKLNSPVIGRYRVEEGSLIRAQMFHFDTAQVVAFLRRACLGR